MKLKIFVQTVTNYELLEKEVNRWMELNSNYVVEATDMLVFSPAGSKEDKIMLQIWYTEE